MSPLQLSDKQIDELRAKHGRIYAVDFTADGEAVTFVMRAPVFSRTDAKVDEFGKIWPAMASASIPSAAPELMALVVHPEPAIAQKHMADYPTDIYDLATGFTELSGLSDFAEDAAAVSPEQRAKYGKRVFGFSIGGGVFAARAMSKPEYSKFADDCGGKPHRPTAAALLTVAWNCVLEPLTDSKKPVFEAAMQAHPWAALKIGSALFDATSTEATVRAKK